MILSHKSLRFNAVPVAITLVKPAHDEERERHLAEVAAAREEGRRQGYEEAMQALQHQILQQRTELSNLQENTLRAITGQHEALVDEFKVALPELVLEVMRRVLAGTEIDRPIIEAIVREVLSEIAPGTPDVTIQLSPRDHEMMSELEEEFGHKYPGIKLVATPILQSGDCVAKSHFGTIDARLISKMSNMAKALR